MYAFRLQVPEGVDALDVEFQYLSPTAADQGRVAMTPNLLDLQWHRVVLYPAGYDARGIQVKPALRLPRAGERPRWMWPGATARSSTTRRCR
jgi:hypothetical protein